MTRADYRIIADALYKCRPSQDHFRYKVWEQIMTSVGEELVGDNANLSLEWWMDNCFFGRAKSTLKDPFKKTA